MKIFLVLMLCFLSSCNACGEYPPPLKGQCRVLELRGPDAAHKDCHLDGCRWDCWLIGDDDPFKVPDWKCTLVSCTAEAK